MVNNVATAKQDADKNSCKLEDLEIVEKGVAAVASVDSEGQVEWFKENDYNESYPGYYFCNNCSCDWPIFEGRQDEAWAEVKEHLNG